MILIARDIEQELSEATSKLLEMAKRNCWNKISNRTNFILTEMVLTTTSTSIQIPKKHKKSIAKKTPMSLTKIASELEKFYMGIYDINLYIHKISRDMTTIDVQYLLKSSLDTEYQKTISKNKPMVHGNIQSPVYADSNFGKFDLKWNKGGLRHQINLFFWYRKRDRKKRA